MSVPVCGVCGSWNCSARALFSGSRGSLRAVRFDSKSVMCKFGGVRKPVAVLLRRRWRSALFAGFRLQQLMNAWHRLMSSTREHWVGGIAARGPYLSSIQWSQFVCSDCELTSVPRRYFDQQQTEGPAACHGQPTMSVVSCCCGRTWRDNFPMSSGPQRTHVGQ